MKAEAMLQRGGPVARSLRITGSTHAMVVAFSAAISLNGMVAAQATGLLGEAAALAVIFASVAACSAAVSIDVLNRSSKTVADLRSIGASRWSISSALFGSMFAFGAVGSALGGLAGGAIGSAIAGTGFGTSALMEAVAVVAVSASAVAAGSYVGGRATWRR